MKELRVRDVMTQEVTALKRNDQLSLADDIMQPRTGPPPSGTRR